MMRRQLKRELLRAQSSYRRARQVADGFALANGLLAVVGMAYALVLAVPEASAVWYAAGIVSAGVIFAAFTWLLRELVQAVFDIADAALQGSPPSVPG